MDFRSKFLTHVADKHIGESTSQPCEGREFTSYTTKRPNESCWIDLARSFIRDRQITECYGMSACRQCWTFYNVETDRGCLYCTMNEEAEDLSFRWGGSSLRKSQVWAIFMFWTSSGLTFANDKLYRSWLKLDAQTTAVGREKISDSYQNKKLLKLIDHNSNTYRFDSDIKTRASHIYSSVRKLRIY